ncbi:MAG: hypothetical protein L6R40_007510 [Gallowayella cf. fulva]|nr:MAG: hypothetical protein L6R40_007510 [Xanthomendoza cf. fulva]
MRSFALLATAFAALAAAAPKPDNNTPAPAEAITLTNIVYLVNTTDKVERSTKLAIDYLQKVKENEPDTLEYDISYEHAEGKFVIYAVYKDEQALDHHKNTSYLADLLATIDEEQLEREDNQIHFLDRVAGFERSGSCD